MKAGGTGPEALSAGPGEKNEAADCGEGTGRCCLKVGGARAEEDRTLSLWLLPLQHLQYSSRIFISQSRVQYRRIMRDFHREILS